MLLGLPFSTGGAENDLEPKIRLPVRFRSKLAARYGPPPRVVRVPPEPLLLSSELLPRCGGPRPAELEPHRRWGPVPGRQEGRSDPPPRKRRRGPYGPAAHPDSPVGSDRKPAWLPKGAEELHDGGNRLVGGGLARAGVVSHRATAEPVAWSGERRVCGPERELPDRQHSKAPPPLPSPSSPSSRSPSGSIGGGSSSSPGGASSAMGLYVRGGLGASKASSSASLPSVGSRSTLWVQLSSPSGSSPAGAPSPSGQWGSASVSGVGQPGPGTSSGISDDAAGSSTGFASLVQ